MFVTDGRTLSAMNRAGFIVWSRSTVRHWTGRPVKVCYVDAGPNIDRFDRFTYHGEQYELRYLDGCFNPFVFKVGAKAPAFA